MNREIKLCLAAPRGFCAGVDRAIAIVDEALKKYGIPVYVKHQIVHNEYVVDELAAKGAIFVEDLDEVPEGNVVIFSAHGVPPAAYSIAEKRHLRVIDATCPLVMKVHREVLSYRKRGYQIIVIGHKNHVEVIGTMGYAAKQTILIENIDDVEKLNIQAERLAYTTQTTLSFDDTKEIINALKKKYPHIKEPRKDDICYATQNRQNAVKALAKYCDLVLVFGSHTSSNSNRLAEVGQNQGVPAYLIENIKHIDLKWLDHVQRVGITSGASTPEFLVQETIDWFHHHYEQVLVEQVVIEEEDVIFALPKELRDVE